MLHPSTVYPLTLGPPRKIRLPSDSLRLFAFFFRSLVFLRLTLKPSTFPSAFTRRSATSRRLSSKLLMEKENQKSNYTLSAFSKTEHAAQKSLNTTGPCQASVAQRISGHNCAPGCSKKRVPFFAA